MEDAVLQQGDAIPHVTVTDLDGRQVEYARDAWQRRVLVLLTLPAPTPAPAVAYAARLRSVCRDLPGDISCVATADVVPGAPPYMAMVADQWGEIIAAAAAADVDALPDPAAIADWVQFTTQRCPECEGEAR